MRGVGFSRDDLALLQMEGFHWPANAEDVAELALGPQERQISPRSLGLSCSQRQSGGSGSKSAEIQRQGAEKKLPQLCGRVTPPSIARNVWDRPS